MNTILAIETSTAACSVALLHNGEITEVFEMLPQKHAQRVLEMVDEVLQQTGLSHENIDYLAFGEGPGAFTGVRIAAGVVQGLALGWNKPVIGISSLEAMCYSDVISKSHEDPSKPVYWIALMDARMQEIYLQTGVYKTDTANWEAGAPCMLSETATIERIKALPELNQCHAYGDILDAYPNVTGLFKEWNESLPRAGSIAHLANLKPEMAKPITEEVPLPVYLRNDVAETIEQRRAKAND